jgi:hypothetical protein
MESDGEPLPKKAKTEKPNAELSTKNETVSPPNVKTEPDNKQGWVRYRKSHFVNFFYWFFRCKNTPPVSVLGHHQSSVPRLRFRETVFSFAD